MRRAKKAPKKARQVKDLPKREIAKHVGEKVKGARAWDIPSGTASPSA